MNLVRSRPSQLKLLACGLAAVVGAIAFFGPASELTPVMGSAHGPTPGVTSAPGEVNCTACHGDFPANSGSGNIQITGIPANYRPGQSFPVSVTLSQADGVIWGFQLTALDALGRRVGTYTIPPATPSVLQLGTGIINGTERQYIMHTINGTSSPVFGSKTWNFTWTAPAQRVGKIGFYVAGNAANSDGGPGGDRIYTGSDATLSGSAIANFDSDVKSDISVFRPSTGVWYSVNSSNDGFNAVQFGLSGDLIAPGDYDGDGITDRTVFRPSTGVWYVAKSSGGVSIIQWGLSGDIPVPGDYDGDLKNDIAVWRPSTGVWYIVRSSDGGFDFRAFGLSTDKVAQGDFDGDAKTDLAVYRPGEGLWYIWRSTDGGFSIFGFGLSGDIPVQSDYDGDGRTDAAVYRPSNGVWYLLESSNGFRSLHFGISTDKPAPADFNGDGLTDIAVFREGTWYILNSVSGSVSIIGFGSAGDVPIPSGYLAP